MRNIERYKKRSGTKKQRKKLNAINKFQDEIAKIVSRWTGIPITKLMEGEREKILNLDKILHKRVIGQDEAVEKVSEAISALQVLGYSRKEIENALKNIEKENLTVEEIIKKGLNNLAR